MKAIHLSDPTRTTKTKSRCRFIRDALATEVEEDVTCKHCINLILEGKGRR